MNTYKRHRFSPDIISYAVWLYYRFNLSHRDIEDLLAERCITVSREAIHLWCIKFGAQHYHDLRINAFIEWSRAVACTQIPGFCYLEQLICQYLANP
jgi:transposase-like protein